MPRPSLKETRSREILDAFVRCIARHGVEGATQDRIAAEAGVKRTLLRHYLGNREAMIDRVITHVCDRFNLGTKELREALPEKNPARALVSWLFDPAMESDADDLLAFQALSHTCTHVPAHRDHLLASMNQFIRTVKCALDRTFPDSAPSIRESTAYGIASIYVSHDSLKTLNPPDEWRCHAMDAANALLTRLEGRVR